MRIKLSKTATGYQTKIFDETKLLPDPIFSRELTWNPGPVLDPKTKEESEADFEKRVDAHKQAVAAWEEQIQTEARRLYEAEFSPTAPVEVSEKEF